MPRGLFHSGGRRSSWPSLLGLLPLLLAGCAHLPSPSERRQHADALAAQAGWRPLPIPAAGFQLMAYLPAAPRAGETLSVYIEGDGFAWLTPAQPSPDPTPREPIALRLALADESTPNPLTPNPPGPVAYLARPCQYAEGKDRACGEPYWTERRFAPEVIAAMDQAVDTLKVRTGARRLRLMGYSGGGAVAALLAARRGDVAALVTVAGNLDHAAWTAHHRLPPLAGSLNPADFRAALQAIPQWHFVGERDPVMPAAIARGYAAGFPAADWPRVIVVPGQDHRCCWAEAWASLRAQIP